MKRKEMVTALRALDAERLRIEDQMEEEAYDSLVELAAQVEGMLAQEGFAKDDLMEFWGPPTTTPAVPDIPPAPDMPNRSGNVRIRYHLKTDATKGRTQQFGFRGPTPRWLKEAMAGEGYDPNSRDQRIAFRDAFMDSW